MTLQAYAENLHIKNSCSIAELLSGIRYTYKKKKEGEKTPNKRKIKQQNK